MMDEHREEINEFGRDVVIKARDVAILGNNDLLQGKVIAFEAPLYERVKKMQLDEQEIITITLLVAEAIDSFMHRFFVNFNESCGKYQIITKDKNGNDIDLLEVSDGLHYEYFGFIEEFSKYNSVEDILETGKLEKETPSE